MKLETIIEEVKKINLKNEFSERERRQRGDCFNIFNILGLWSDERSHSVFLAELLNPVGSHGMRDALLRLFIKDRYNEFETNGANVEVEFFIGNKSDDGTSGGRIDIIITSANKQQAIIIENKIYAKDQECQLLRYHNYARKKFKNYKLFYLTLNGEKPSEFSLGGENVTYESLSYVDDILNWLRNCQKEVFNKPIVRETIGQYITLIKQLTNNTMEESEKEEILKTVMKDAASVKSALKIAECANDIKLTAIKKILVLKIKKVVSGIEKDKKVKIYFEHKHDYEPQRKEIDYRFDFFIQIDNTPVTITYFFSTWNLRDLWWGLEKERNKNIQKSPYQFEESAESWLGYSYCKHRNWLNPDDFYAAIENFDQEVDSNLRDFIDSWQGV